MADEQVAKSNLEKAAQKANPFGKSVAPEQRQEQIKRVEHATDIRSIGLTGNKAQISVAKDMTAALKDTGAEFIKDLTEENQKLIKDMVTQIGGLSSKSAKQQEKFLDKILEMSEKLIEEGKKSGNEKLQKLGEKTNKSADQERARLKGMNLRGSDDNKTNRAARDLFDVDMESKLKTNPKDNTKELYNTEKWQERKLKERGIEAQGIGWKKKDAEGKFRNLTKDQLREEVKDVNNNTIEGKVRGVAKVGFQSTKNVLKAAGGGFVRGLAEPFGFKGITNSLDQNKLTDEQKRDIDAAEKDNPDLPQGKIKQSAPEDTGVISSFGEQAISQLKTLLEDLTKKEQPETKKPEEKPTSKILDKDGKPFASTIAAKPTQTVEAEADKSASETQEEAAGISNDPKIKLHEETNNKLDEIISLLKQQSEGDAKGQASDSGSNDDTSSGGPSFDPTDLIPDRDNRRPGRRPRSLRGRARLARMKVRGAFRSTGRFLGNIGKGILNVGSRVLGMGGGGAAVAQGAATAAEGIAGATDAAQVASRGASVAEGASTATQAASRGASVAEGASTATQAAAKPGILSRAGGAIKSVAGKATGAIGNVASKAGGLVSKGAGLLGKAGPGLLKGLGTVGRVAGKFAAPLAIGMAAYDAYKGWNADPNATTGQKFKNAGRNILSGLTFGLVDSTQDKMDKGEYTGTQVAPPGAQGAAPAGAPVQGAIAGGAAQRITNPTAATPAGKPEQPGFFSRHRGALMGAALGPVGVLGGMAYDKFFGNNQVKSGQNNDSGMLAAGSEEARDKMNINVPPPTVISNSTGADANKTSPLPTSPITVRDDDSSWMRFTLKRAMA